MRGRGATSTRCGALLAEDAVFSMPPWASWWRGRETIAGFAKAAVEFCAEARAVPTRANGQPAVAYYAPGRGNRALHGRGDRRPHVRGRRIKEITAFVIPEIFPRFGLPAELAA